MKLKLIALITVVTAGCYTLQAGTAFAQTINSSRYQIFVVTGENRIILLDTQSGNTWRNIVCPDPQQLNADGSINPLHSGGPLNCWQSMTYIDSTPQDLEKQLRMSQQKLNPVQKPAK